jgi:hypothetical protein
VTVRGIEPVVGEDTRNVSSVGAASSVYLLTGYTYVSSPKVTMGHGCPRSTEHVDDSLFQREVMQAGNPSCLDPSSVLYTRVEYQEWGQRPAGLKTGALDLGQVGGGAVIE